MSDSAGPGDADRVAVVTGAGKGIGKAIALRLARDGYDVGVLDVEPTAEEVVADVQRLGRRCLFVSTDVSDSAQVQAAAERVAAELGEASVLVNNAGIYLRSLALDMDWEQWQQVLAVNLGGTFLCSKVFGGPMLAAKRGVVVNIASGRALEAAVRGASYSASKAGIVSLTRTLALEWAPHVRVNVVIPGLTDTDQPRGSGATTEELYQRAQQRVPLERIGQPDDVAGVVSFLVGPDASYLTGASVCVNGGSLMA